MREHRTAIVVACFLAGSSAAENIQIREDFSTDRGWSGRNHRPDPNACVTKVQDFGYRRSRHAGGAVGEIGGRVSRSLTPATFAVPIPKRTLRDRLRASGRFAVTHAESSSGVLIGWFHESSRGWRTPHSLVLRIDGEQDSFRVFFEYGTSSRMTGGGQTFDGPYQTTTTPMLAADGTPHTWAIDYDPDGADGAGEIALTLDDTRYRAALAPGHKDDGAAFNRFGIMNVQIAGRSLELWLDDVTLDGEREAFTADPQWIGQGNGAQFRDCAVRPQHDFGHRTSSYAGGRPGEVGGLMWRIENDRPDESCVYARSIGTLSLDDELRASGKVALRAAAVDSAILIGWFHSDTTIGAPPPSFVGVLIEGPSRIGHYVRPIARPASGDHVLPDRGPRLAPDGSAHDWSCHYRPATDESPGRLSVTLDEETISVDVPNNWPKAATTFDRFGFVSWHQGGHFVDIYFDDLSFTASRAAR